MKINGAYAMIASFIVVGLGALFAVWSDNAATTHTGIVLSNISTVLLIAGGLGVIISYIISKPNA